MYRPEDLRLGDIILCEGALDVRDPLGLLMVWASDNPFQHAALVGDGELLESLDVVGTAPLEAYAPVGWRFQVAGATPVQLRTAVSAAQARVGEAYGYRALAREGGPVPLYRRFDPHDVVSSGLVCWAFARAAIRLSWQPLPTPASLSYSPLLLGPRPWREVG